MKGERKGGREGGKGEWAQASIFIWAAMKKKNVVIIAGSQTMIHSGQLGYENVA